MPYCKYETDELIDCPCCEGVGVHDEDIADNGPPYHVEVTCDTCDGWGKVRIGLM